MTSAFDPVVNLNEVRQLLLDPTPSAMAKCEQKLRELLDEMRRDGQGRWRPEIRQAMKSIQSLLAKAHGFWASRRLAAAPSSQYTPGGHLIESAANSTFAWEA